MGQMSRPARSRCAATLRLRVGWAMVPQTGQRRFTPAPGCSRGIGIARRRSSRSVRRGSGRCRPGVRLRCGRSSRPGTAAGLAVSPSGPRSRLPEHHPSGGGHVAADVVEGDLGGDVEVGLVAGVGAVPGELLLGAVDAQPPPHLGRLGAVAAGDGALGHEAYRRSARCFTLVVSVTSSGSGSMPYRSSCRSSDAGLIPNRCAITRSE